MYHFNKIKGGTHIPHSCSSAFRGKSPPPQCPPCDVPLTVHYILTSCFSFKVLCKIQFNNFSPVLNALAGTGPRLSLFNLYHDYRFYNEINFTFYTMLPWNLNKLFTQCYNSIVIHCSFNHCKSSYFALFYFL